MATHHRGAGYPIAINIDLHVEDPEATGIDKYNGVSVAQTLLLP